jgi:hypothetical protein
MLNLPHALCVRAVRGRRGAISSGKVWKGLERSESVLARTLLWVGGFGVAAGFLRGRTRSARMAASSRDIFGCSKNRQNRIVENSTYPLDDFGFR